MANLFGLPLTNDYGADQSRQRRIADLIGSGRNFNQQEAQDFASAFGISDPQRFVGIGGQQALQFARKFNPNQSISNPFDPSTNLPFLKRMAGAKLPFTNITVPNVIPSDMVFGSKKFNSVDQPQDNTDITNFKSGFDTSFKSLQDYINQINQPLEQMQTENTGTQNKFLEIMKKLIPQGQQQLAKQEEFGYSKNVKDLQNIMAQLAQKSASFDAGIQATEGKVIPMEAIAGQQSFLQRQKAVELGGLASVAQALQGNITLAQETAKNVIDLEFAPIQRELDVLRQQLDFNTENMTAAEKKRAEALGIQLDERQRVLDEEKVAKEGVLSIGTEAAKNGADAQTLNAIIQAKTPEEALQKAGKFLTDPKLDTQIVEVEGKRKLINSQTGAVIADLGKATSAERASIAEQLAALEGGYNISYDTEGNPVVSDPAQGIVGGYDIGTYATDPQHEQKVASILTNLGQLTTPEEIDSYIQSVAPGSPITSTMIQNTSQKYGVSWEMLIAMMQQDSSLGTAGIGARNFNPGNIAQYDSLGTTPTKGYKSWQQGVDAVGKWLSDHKATQTQTNAELIAQDIFNGSSSIDVSQYPTKQREAINKALVKLKNEAKSSGDIEGLIKGSAGGKDVAESFITSFDKAANVVYQVNDLQDIFSNEKLSKDYVKQQKKDTGVDLNPIWGKVRSLNPWDKDAQAIKASLQAIVPNLARGIYGEVGVLTDNDIKNYAQTLPTLTSTEEVRKAVLGITIRSVQRAIENKLKSQAASGRDVSGYLTMYQELKGIADGLLNESGMTESQVKNQWKSSSGKNYNLPY